MFANPVERPRYYEGQYLGADDLTAALAYTQGQSARHALGPHTWGIVVGLELKEITQPGTNSIQIYLQPGFAWDGFGRQIVVAEPTVVSAELFKSFTHVASDEGDPKGRMVEVWLRYQEDDTQPPTYGYELCDASNQYARVLEGFKVEAGPRPDHKDRHDPISVAGKLVDAEEALSTTDSANPPLYDETAPFQIFPVIGASDRWLIPLGAVRWYPNPSPTQSGNFVARNSADLEYSRIRRRYTGVVAEEIYAPAGFIRLRDRAKAYGTVRSDDLVWVEGRLRVDGDLRLFGSVLSLLNSDGQDNGVALNVQRGERPAVGGKAIQIALGTAADGKNALEVGPVLSAGGGPATFTPRLTVQDNGNVGLGTAQPGAMLELRGGDLLMKAAAEDPGDLVFQNSTGAQKGRVWSNPQSGAALHLSSGDNTPDLTIDSNGNVGIGTTSPNETLEINGSIRGNMSGALRINTPTGWTDIGSKNANWSHFYTDRPRFYFNNEIRIDSGFIGSYNEDLSLRTSGATRLTISDANGNIGLNNAAPATALHVMGDRIRLENNGKRLDLRADGNDVDLHSETTNLHVRSSGPGGHNNVFINPQLTDGKVGIGLQAVECKLHVRDSLNADASLTSSHVALIENQNTANSAGVLALKVGISQPGAGNNFITFFGGNNAVGRIEGNGSGGIALRSGGADFAECLPRLEAGEAIEPGDLVGVLDSGAGARVTRRVSQGAHHISVVSENPVVVGNAPLQGEDEFYECVAFVGQVGVKVRGPVQAGDFIVPSGLDDGVGVAVSPQAITPAQWSQVAGQAWESAPGAEVKKVKTAIGRPAGGDWMAAVMQSQADEIRSLRAAVDELTRRMEPINTQRRSRRHS